MSRRVQSQSHGAGILFVSTVAVLAAVMLGLRLSGVLPPTEDHSESPTFRRASLEKWNAIQTPSTTVGDAIVLHADGTGFVRMPELDTMATQLNDPATTVERDFEILDLLIDSFRRANGGANPAGGENEEIVGQLRGQNAKHLAVLRPDHPAINDKGQLVDRWGTPFHFHPLSRGLLEVRSAGPDKKLFTNDDLLTEI